MKPSEKIPLFKVFMADTAAPEVTKVLNSGFIGQGPKVCLLYTSPSPRDS